MTFHIATSTVSRGCPPTNNARKRLIPGVHVPTLAFFDASIENADLITTADHAVKLAKAGMTGIIVQGSNSEAVHPSNSERRAITRTTREALGQAGLPSLSLVIGCRAQSTRNSIELRYEAVAHGGDYSLVLVPSYYQAQLTPSTIVEFFNDVANASPISLITYNHPAAASGLDLSSDIIIRLVRHPNIIGCRLTCRDMENLVECCLQFRTAVLGLCVWEGWLVICFKRLWMVVRESSLVSVILPPRHALGSYHYTRVVK